MNSLELFAARLWVFFMIGFFVVPQVAQSTCLESLGSAVVFRPASLESLEALMRLGPEAGFPEDQPESVFRAVLKDSYIEAAFLKLPHDPKNLIARPKFRNLIFQIEVGGRPVGLMGLQKPPDSAGPIGYSIEFASRSLFVWIVLEPEWRGKGIAFQAAKGLVDFAENTLAATVYWQVRDPLNEASKKLARRLGFDLLDEGIPEAL